LNDVTHAIHRRRREVQRCQHAVRDGRPGKKPPWSSSLKSISELARAQLELVASAALMSSTWRRAISMPFGGSLIGPLRKVSPHQAPTGVAQPLTGGAVHGGLLPERTQCWSPSASRREIRPGLSATCAAIPPRTWISCRGPRPHATRFSQPKRTKS